jgi:acetylornithine/N-succinyldiaminopimelate aminotransferase
MIGVETKKDVNEIISKCIERGVLPIKAKNKLRLLPALNIPWDLLKKAVEIIKEVAKENV